MLYQEIDKLNKRDKQIMILRYGLYNNQEMTQKDVANMLGISQSYISRIEKKVIRRLKGIVKNWFLFSLKNYAYKIYYNIL